MNQRIKDYGAIALLILLFGFAVNLPFVEQAFHIDDRLNLYMSRQILRDPGNPYDFSMVFLGGKNRKFYEFYANPPLAGYVLAVPLKVFGEGEVPLHLTFTLFTMLAGFCMYLLAMRFGLEKREGRFAAVLMLMSPGVFVMGHTIMPDIQLLTLMLAAVVVFLRAEDNGKPLPYLAAGLLAALATLTRYSGLILAPLFLVHTLLRHRRMKIMPVAAMAMPVVALGAWHLIAVSLYGAKYWSTIMSLEVGGNRIVKAAMQVLASVTQLGGAGVFAPALLLVLPVLPVKARRTLLAAVGGVSLVGAGILISSFAHTPGQAVQFVLMAFPAFAFLGLLLISVRGWIKSRPEFAFLVFWIFFLILFNSSFLHTAVKYNILELPPLIILFIWLVGKAKEKNIVGKQKEKSKSSTSLLFGTAVLTAGLGILVAAGDTRFANAYRSFADYAIKIYKTGTGSLYYGGDWGWDYYMNKAGLKPVISTGMPELKAGDIAITPSLSYPQPLPKDKRDRAIVERQIAFLDWYPVRTHNVWAKAFFYSNNITNSIGVMPFSFSSAPLEIFSIVKIK